MMSAWTMALARSCKSVARGFSRCPKMHTTNKVVGGAISIQPVSESYYAEVIDHVTPIFLRDEPLSQCFPPCTTGRRERDFRNYAEQQLRSGLCVVALDGGTVVGACLNRPLSKEQVMNYPLPPSDDEAEDPLNASVVRMIVTIHRQLNLFSTLGVDKLLEIGLVSVAPTHIGRGLAVKMVRASVELGARKGFRAAKADCTGPASARACEKAGMAPVHRLLYDEYKVKGEVVFRQTTTRGPALTVMAAKLQDSPPYVIPATPRPKI
ncbi:arylalkylamine N-acetyltransferase-like 2 isoform X2 [Periplaneta americana]|uniref:arylalkylamine N-acetyltransferase-like 2 isoform X2 n=1 Tax=Periplaneta americana TaxID=6978 RepID=UPI0037E8618B